MTKNWVNSVITNDAHFLGWFMEVFVLLLFLVSFQSPLSAQENAGDKRNASWGALYFILPWTTHDDGLHSDVILTNTEQRPNQIQISAYDRNGLPVFVDNIINTLEPIETSIIDTKLLPPNIASLRVDANGSIDGSVNFGTADGKKSATIPAFSTGSKQLDFPPLYGDFKYRSLILFNPNDQYTTLAVSAFDNHGKEIAPAPFDLIPMTTKETRTIALSEIFDTNIQSNVATVRIIANKPLIGFELANDVSRNLLLDQALAVSLSSVSMAALTPTWPLPGYKVGSNKFCSFVSGRGYHTGVDIGSPNLNPNVISMCKGFVVLDTTHRNTGNYLNYWNGFLIVKHDCDEDGKVDFYGYYGHLISKSDISSVCKESCSKPVSRNEFLGTVRDAYKSDTVIDRTNNHLHLSIGSFYVSSGWGYRTSCDNVKTVGFVDPLPYFPIVGPDFTVTAITISPTSPGTNSTFSATVTVKNQGAVSGNAGRLDVWTNQASNQVCGAVGNKYQTVGALASGESKTLTFTGLSAGAVGSKTFRTFIDSTCATVEANESNNQATKSYSVETPPTAPTSLLQYRSDGVTGIAFGGTTPQSTVVLKGKVSSPNGGNLKLQVELRRLDELGGGFNGAATQTSALVASGATASITVGGLINGNYHWRARTVSATGVASGWVSAGGNADTAADFVVAVGSLPSTVSVNPTSGNWTSSPQNVSVSSSGASQIYYTIRYTLDGSTPADPPEPSSSVKDGTIAGSSGTFQVYASAGQYKKLKVRFRGYNSTGYGPTSGSYLYTIDLRSGSLPGAVSVSPASGTWNTSPQHLSLSSSGATTIYYTMVNTYNGSTPADPPTPTPSANNGSLSGPSGTFELYASAGQHKRSKLRFVGCNSLGCGPATGSYLYAIDLHQPNYEGWIDDANCTSIWGWAWDTYLAETPINVDIYDGSSKIATVSANQFRQDLLNAGKGNGYHGFTYSTPSSLRDGNTHTVYVKYGGTGSNLNGSPKTLTCAGYASVSQGLNVSPTPVKLGQNFTISFTLRETRGSDKTFENLAIAIIDPSGNFIFDFVMYNSVTVPANGTKSFSAQNYIYSSRPQGTYKAVARGKPVGGNWFDFDTVDSGVNPRSFSVVQ